LKYLLDANVFIQAKDLYYRPDICPGFWDWLEDGVQGSFGTIDRVRDELVVGKDYVSTWFKGHKGASWIAATTDEATQVAFQQVTTWVSAGLLTPEKIKFLSCADPWLVAHAVATKASVVTLEMPKNSPNKVSLVDACVHFKVATLKTWDLLALLKVKFVRES
jgi:hypothetical protein